MHQASIWLDAVHPQLNDVHQAVERVQLLMDFTNALQPQTLSNYFTVTTTKPFGLAAADYGHVEKLWRASCVGKKQQRGSID